MKRTAQQLADALERDFLNDVVWGLHGTHDSVEVAAKSRKEADALIAELRKRGWKVHLGLGLILPEGETMFTGAHLVTITGRLAISSSG